VAGRTIAKAAREAGVNVETIRYYERRGLIDQPRGLSGYRTYPEETIRRVRFIKRAQALGFSLREIKDLLALRRGRAGTSAEVRRKAEAKLAGIDGKIRELRAMREGLQTLAAACPGSGPVERCPILNSFEDGDGDSSPRKG